MIARRGFLLAAVLVLASPGFTWASSHDLGVQQFFLPATSTSGYRVHTSRTHMNVTIPRGNIWAAGGYKTPLQFAHVATASLTNFAIGLGQSGVTAQRLGAEGSVLGAMNEGAAGFWDWIKNHPWWSGLILLILIALAYYARQQYQHKRDENNQPR